MSYSTMHLFNIHLFNRNYLVKKFNTIYIRKIKYIFLGYITKNDCLPNINCVYINDKNKVILRTVRIQKFKNNIEFEIPGKPTPKGRPRFARRGRFVTTYTDNKTLTSESQIKSTFLKIKDLPKIAEDTPVSVNIDFLMPIPVSISKKKQEALNHQPCITKPDLDNMVKTILDALNKVSYSDDSLISEIVCRKFYSKEPKSIIKICY